MSDGRTSWWPKDAAWHRRERIVELGEEHGPGGPLVVDVISAWAQEQRAGGAVRGGFRTLAREAFVPLDEAREIVRHAAENGALDELEVDADGRRFTCRVSGWQADQARGRAAVRKANQRAAEAETEADGVTVSHGESRPVTPSALPDLTREEKIPPIPPQGGRQRGREQFRKDVLAWIAAIGLVGDDHNLLRAYGQAEPWKRNGDAADYFFAFVDRHFHGVIS